MAINVVLLVYLLGVTLCWNITQTGSFIRPFCDGKASCMGSLKWQIWPLIHPSHFSPTSFHFALSLPSHSCCFTFHPSPLTLSCFTFIPPNSLCPLTFQPSPSLCTLTFHPSPLPLYPLFSATPLHCPFSFHPFLLIFISLFIPPTYFAVPLIIIIHSSYCPTFHSSALTLLLNSHRIVQAKVILTKDPQI